MRRGLGLVAVLSGGLLVGACGGSSKSDGSPGTGPVAEGDFIQKVADAVCGNLSGCCAATGLPYDRAGCEAYVLGELELDVSPNTTWDSVAAGRCVDWFVSVASSCRDSRDNREPCQDIYRGTLPEGAPCTASEECADIRGTAATCAYDSVTSMDTCAREIEPIRGRAGDACSSTCSADSCVGFGSPEGGAANTICHVEDGLLCSSVQGLCVPPPRLGEACFDYYCGAGAYCSNVSLVCTATKPNGQSCEFSEECTGSSCADGICGPRTLATSELCSGQ